LELPHKIGRFNMSTKKLLSILVVFTIFISAFVMLNQSVTSAVAVTSPANLKVYVGPSSVLADNNTYNCIFVQLQDSNGKPARAIQDTTISLSSSLTTIGTVSPSITILKGTTFASTYFTSTFSPGTTTISASATGYSTVQSSITTIGPIPSAVAVYGFPSTLPSDGLSYNAIMVQLQDSNGAPAKAPQGGVQVTLSSGDTTVGTVTPTVTIPEGKTYTITSFTTTTKAQTEARTVSAMVYAVAQGFTTGQTTITTTPIGTSGTQNKIMIFIGPNKVLADQNSYKLVAIELQNSNGYVLPASSNIAVTVGSSDESIGKIEPQITIPTGSAYVLATFNSTFKSGSTIITAIATDFVSNQQTINTFGFIPSKLAVYSSPAILPSDNAPYQAIQVQLQDSQGRPAKDPQSAVTISLFSSQPSVATMGSALTIPFGSTQATGSLTVTNTPGSTTITAQAPGYTTGQGTITTYLIDYSTLQVTLTANPQSVGNGAKSSLSAYVTAGGTPVTGATVQFTSDNGGSFTAVNDQGSGYYSADFTAPNFSQTSTCTVTATVSKENYLSGQNALAITVTSATNPSATPTPSSTSDINSITLLITDSNGKPQNNTLVETLSQPAGMTKLTEITNSTGWVKFNNTQIGTYNFVAKTGDISTNKTFVITNLPYVDSIMLNGDNTGGGISSSLLIIIIVVIVIVVAAVAGGLLVLRRRGKARIRKLQEMQKQLKYKY
jgi:hypothetical protein